MKEAALATLVNAASRRLMIAEKRELTARPAASSAGSTIFEPELNLARDLDNRTWLAFRLFAVACAGMLVLMTTLSSGLLG